MGPQSTIGVSKSSLVFQNYREKLCRNKGNLVEKKCSQRTRLGWEKLPVGVSGHK